MRVGVIGGENHMVFQPMLPVIFGGSLTPQHVVNSILMICLHEHAEEDQIKWCAVQGSNLRPHPCEGCALPLS